MMAELAPQSKTGSYERPSYASDEKERYHIYFGNPCPWCHRVKLAVALKQFKEENIGETRLVDDPVKASRGGWVFSSNEKDPLGSYDLVSYLLQVEYSTVLLNSQSFIHFVAFCALTF